MILYGLDFDSIGKFLQHRIRGDVRITEEDGAVTVVVYFRTHIVRFNVHKNFIRRFNFEPDLAHAILMGIKEETLKRYFV